MSLEMKSCAFTGHRQIKDTHKKAIVDILARAVEYAYSKGCRSFFSGGAIGFDTEAARAVLRFRISHPDVKLIMLLPCIEQDARWNDRQKDSYGYILSCADEVRYISDEYDDSCMKRRNTALAEECDLMIAYVSRRNSGAAQTVRMAEQRGKTVYNLWHTLEEGENK